MSRVIDDSVRGPMSVIVAAHNEESTIGRLLTALLAAAEPGEFEIHVMCNGCTDRTAQIATGFGPDVRVSELPQPSKREALKAGDAVASSFPRLYLDADVELSTAGVRALRSALQDDDVLVAAPERRLGLTGVPLSVRSYYAVWQQLPAVRAGVFGRGAIAVSEAGYERIARLPMVMSDDLAMSEAFSDAERRIVSDAVVTVWPPRTLPDLVRRRIRVGTGVAELDTVNGRSAEAKTSWSDLAAIVRRRPSLAARVPVFVGVAVLAKVGARRRVKTGDYHTWLRDESSRRTGSNES